MRVLEGHELSLRLELTPFVTIECLDGGTWVDLGGAGRHQLNVPEPVGQALATLCDRPTWARLRDELWRSSHPDEPPAMILRLAQELMRMFRTGLLGVAVESASGRIMRAVPMGPLADLQLPSSPRTRDTRLSRFVVIRRRETDIVVSCAHRSVDLIIEDASFAGNEHLLSNWHRLPDAVADLMSATGALVADDPEPPNGLPSAPYVESVLWCRDPVDVAFHHRSRRGLSREPVGGTFRFDGTIPPPPAIRPAGAGARLSLPLPPRGGPADDANLLDVVARRRSHRAHGSSAITFGELGEFLYRVGRVERVIPIDRRRGARYEASVRPYPSGGATYDLEFYLTVDRCTGLAPGFYRYLPASHELESIAASPLERQALLDCAIEASGAQSSPQVLITLASRFVRLNWKYEGIAYATTLKNVGVLYEFMYLVATAMNLAPCALGYGDAAAFSKATGLRADEESSVGEFMLGSRVDG